MFSYLEYNNLPTVDVSHDASRPLEAVRDALCDLVVKYGLQDRFMVRLIHKHFDMQPNEVPVFRPVEVRGVCTAIVMGPLSIENQTSFVGKNYAISSTGQLAAYEFTSEVTLGAPEDHADFVKAFEAALISGGASQVYGLGVKSATNNEKFVEFELGEYRSTIMVPKAIFPMDKDDIEIHTNWAPGPNSQHAPQDGCTDHFHSCVKDKSGRHHVWDDGDDGDFKRALVDSSSDLSKVLHKSSASAREWADRRASYVYALPLFQCTSSTEMSLPKCLIAE
ncbi:hypothetical protein SISSUDRAFT_1054256 [Sistotremastrum suecicum HHB10207 ss-3]|uniref:Uncharacterized protein n=1 Tax=Sistotremastrum suecicum HHB10207 ss-3 TaxID=1314776 RepID=A0A165YND9_9AGAM|nr:hypothetical protein SISSUDRAFT_1054256 [Sistotremastrum suecicum HHB10207 ss-3]